MINNVILGDGITGYIIAACLNYNNKKCIIYGNDNYTPPSILLLKYKNGYQLKHYFNIFEIPYTNENLKKYTKKIKIGYTTDYCKTIVDEPTQNMINEYFQKQYRDCNKSSMSDGINSFKAIDLKLVYNHLKEKYKKSFVKCNIDINEILKKHNNNVKIYNTVFPTKLNKFEPSIEYISINNNDIKSYDYIYDCSCTSRVKRYTKDYTEYISSPGYYDFKIENYYNEPQIYTTYYAKSNVTWIDISRKATKTQLKQEDIIDYLIHRCYSFDYE